MKDSRLFIFLIVSGIPLLYMGYELNFIFIFIIGICFCVLSVFGIYSVFKDFKSQHFGQKIVNILVLLISFLFAFLFCVIDNESMNNQKREKYISTHYLKVKLDSVDEKLLLIKKTRDSIYRVIENDFKNKK